MGLFYAEAQTRTTPVGGAGDERVERIEAWEMRLLEALAGGLAAERVLHGQMDKRGGLAAECVLHGQMGKRGGLAWAPGG